MENGFVEGFGVEVGLHHKRAVGCQTVGELVYPRFHDSSPEQITKKCNKINNHKNCAYARHVLFKTFLLFHIKNFVLKKFYNSSPKHTKLPFIHMQAQKRKLID